jgi:hypothetical protein
LDFWHPKGRYRFRRPGAVVAGAADTAGVAGAGVAAGGGVKVKMGDENIRFK